MTGTLALRAWECLEKTAGYYHRNLLATPQISSFLKERYGFNKAIIRKYRIGYAENSHTVKHLSGCGFSSKEMAASGVFRPDNRNQSVIHPVFEDQVVFPFAFKDRTVFMTALKQRWKKDFLFPEYQKLPIYDSRNRPWVTKAIDGKVLYNQQILHKQPDLLFITETIPDCITLDHHGFPAVTSTTGTIAEDDWEWIIPQLSGIRKIIFWHNNRITEPYWESTLQASRRLRKMNIPCLSTRPPLEEKHRTARERLRKYGIYPGITSDEMRENMEERSLIKYNEIQRLIAESEIDTCSFFMSGNTVADIQRVLDRALLPVEFALQFIHRQHRMETLHPLLVEIGRQNRFVQDRLLKRLRNKTAERLISLRAEVKAATRKDNDRFRKEIEREWGPPVLCRKNDYFYVKDNTIKQLSLSKSSENYPFTIHEAANFHLRITQEISYDDGEMRESAVSSKTFIGEIVGKTWNKPFHIDAGDWGNNTRLAHRIFEQAGPQARCSTGAIDIIRSLSSILSSPPGTVTVYSCFGFHPTAGFVSPSLTIRQGKIIPTAKTGARVETGSKFGKARCLDLKPSSKKEVQKIIQHLLSDYLDFQAREITLPVLSHAFLGPFLFAMKLEDEFSPQILFLAGAKRELHEIIKLTQSIWGDFGKQPVFKTTQKSDWREAAKCRGGLWTINNFNHSRILQQAAKIRCPLLLSGRNLPGAQTLLWTCSLILKCNGKRNDKKFQNCLSQQQDYRKIPAHYIAWLQKQSRQVWVGRVSNSLDFFGNSLCSADLDSEKSQELISQAALSTVSLTAFLEFSAEIKAVNQNLARSLISEHEKILQNTLIKMLVEMNELKPVDIFLSELEELLRTNRAKILDHYAEDHMEHGIPVIGYFKENRKFICLLPRIVLKTVVNNSHLRDENFDFSTTFISRQLIEHGYIEKPTSGRNLTGRERIPGKGKNSPPERVWKIDASRFKVLENPGFPKQ